MLGLGVIAIALTFLEVSFAGTAVVRPAFMGGAATNGGGPASGFRWLISLKSAWARVRLMESSTWAEFTLEHGFRGQELKAARSGACCRFASQKPSFCKTNPHPPPQRSEPTRKANTVKSYIVSKLASRWAVFAMLGGQSCGLVRVADFGRRDTAYAYAMARDRHSELALLITARTVSRH